MFLGDAERRYRLASYLVHAPEDDDVRETDIGRAIPLIKDHSHITAFSHFSPAPMSRKLGTFPFMCRTHSLSVSLISAHRTWE